MLGFRNRLRAAISASDSYKNDVWRLSTDAGLGRKTVYNILNDCKLDSTQKGPGLFGMARVAELLNTSLDHLAGIAPPAAITASKGKATNSLLEHATETLNAQSAPKRNDELSADRLLRIHAKSGGRIEAFEAYLHRCDQYHPPKKNDSFTKVKAVGEKSLAAITMGSPNTHILQEALEHMQDKELQAKVLDDYRRTIENGTFVSLEALDIPMPNRPVKVKMEFIRVLLSVHDAEGDHTLLNFSFLVI